MIHKNTTVYIRKPIVCADAMFCFRALRSELRRNLSFLGRGSVNYPNADDTIAQANLWIQQYQETIILPCSISDHQHYFPESTSLKYNKIKLLYFFNNGQKKIVWYGKISCPEHHIHDMGVFSYPLFYKYLHIDYNTLLKSL